MRIVFGLVLILGLSLAGFAVYMAQNYINATQAQLDEERARSAKLGPMVDVLITTKAFNYGDELTKDDIRSIPWPQSALPETAFVKMDDLFPAGAKPRLVLRQMEKFEPVLAVKVTEPGEDAGLTTRLAKGMRAFAIKVDVESGVSGFLRPGDKVDVYWTGSVSGSDGDVTRVIESAIKLAAVDQSSNAENTDAVIARTVTVEATPQQVARLAQAQATGRLSLALVGNGDDTSSGVVEVDSKTLLGITDEAPPPPPAEEKVCSVKTRKGADVIDTAIPCTD